MRHVFVKDTQTSSAPGIALALAVFMFSFGNGFGSEGARAQTANDLRCKQCVDSRDIRKKAVGFSQLQRKIRNRIKDLESSAQQEVPFFVKLDGEGALQTIVTNGPLTLFARCRVNDAGEDRVEIVAASSVDGWFSEGIGESNAETGPFTASEQVVILQHQDPTGTTSYAADDSEGSAAAPDGSFIGITGEATGMGINIFGNDCLVAGNAFLVNGTP